MDGDYATVIGVWRRQIREGEPITIIGDGEQRRDFTHVDDIVDGLCRIMDTQYFHEDAWELGTGVNYSINELYAMFSQRFGSLCSRVNLPDLPGNYRVTIREHGDALEKLGWAPVDRLRTYISGL
jgi:UDP-glucose 4-epimerase